MKIIAFIEDYKIVKNILDYVGIYEFERKSIYCIIKWDSIAKGIPLMNLMIISGTVIYAVTMCA